MEAKDTNSRLKKYINKELIGTGSNGNRVYRIQNKDNNKVYFKIIIYYRFTQ